MAKISFLCCLLWAELGNAESLLAATRKLSEHYYRSTYLAEQLKVYERAYVPEIIREHKTGVAILLKLVIEQRISGTWSFP